MRVAGLGPQRCRALEADEAQDGKRDAEGHPVEAGTFELELGSVDRQSTPRQGHHEHDQDSRHRDDLQDQPEPGGQLDPRERESRGHGGEHTK